MVDALIGTYQLFSIRWQCRRDFGQLGKHLFVCIDCRFMRACVILVVYLFDLLFTLSVFGSQKILICEFFIRCQFYARRRKQVPLLNTITTRYAMGFRQNKKRTDCDCRLLSGSPKTNMTHLFLVLSQSRTNLFENKAHERIMICISTAKFSVKQKDKLKERTTTTTTKTLL